MQTSLRQTDAPQATPYSPKFAVSEKKLTAPSAIQNILLCTEFSAASQRAAREAARISKLSGGRLTVLNVSEYGPLPVSDYTSDFEETLLKEQKRLMDAELEKLEKEGIEAQRIHADGDPAIEIMGWVREGGYDLVVLGTHAFRGLERFVFGSTAEAVFVRRLARF